MAINTENKRRSTVAVLPVPESDIGFGDRRQVTWNYSGFTVATPTTATRKWTDVGTVTSAWLARSQTSASWVSRGQASNLWIDVSRQEQD